MSGNKSGVRLDSMLTPKTVTEGQWFPMVRILPDGLDENAEPKIKVEVIEGAELLVASLTRREYQLSFASLANFSPEMIKAIADNRKKKTKAGKATAGKAATGEADPEEQDEQDDDLFAMSMQMMASGTNLLESDDRHAALLGRFILLDWRGFVDDKGDPIPATEEARVAFCKDSNGRAAVMHHAADLAKFQEAELGNSPASPKPASG